MYKIIIFTHDTLSRGLLLTSRTVLGEQPDIEAYSVELGCNLDELTESVRQSIEESENRGQNVLVLTDLMYGTPFNLMIQMADKYHFVHMTGVNLPLLLEAVNRRTSEDFQQAMNGLVDTARNSILDCNLFLQEINNIA